MTEDFRLKIKDEEHRKKAETTLTYLINKIMIELGKKRPKIKNIDSNVFHFWIYSIAQTKPKLMKLLPFGWFIHGPYCFMIDDILVEKFGMDKKYHQLDGKAPYNCEWMSTEFEEEEDGKITNNKD